MVFTAFQVIENRQGLPRWALTTGRTRTLPHGIPWTFHCAIDSVYRVHERDGRMVGYT